MSYLSKALMERMFNDALEEIKGEYVAGLLQNLKMNRPEKYRQIMDAEKALEQTWIQARAGQEHMPRFEQALEGWKQEFLGAIEDHKSRGACPDQPSCPCA